MNNLQKIIDKIRETGEDYRETTNPDVKSFYNQYVEKIVLDETEFCNHDFLFKYWESCKRHGK